MVGEVLVRPSSRHSDSLAVHWVIQPDLMIVVEVLEEDKENDASIGKKLKIKEYIFGSIDELIVRYFGKMNEFVEEIVNHRKFETSTEDVVDENLKAQKQANPKSVPYCLCWSEQVPGSISLRYILNTTNRNHRIKITPDGFLWENKLFPTVDRLLNAFKKNPHGKSGGVKKTAAATKPSIAAEPAAATTRSRWGSRVAAPVAAPAPAVPLVNAWQQQPPPPPARPPPVPVVAAANLPPPPPAYHRGPPMGGVPPPQVYNQPPPPPVPAYPPMRPPPPAPAGPPPPAFANGAGTGGPPVGRGRGRTLPAWMSKQS